MLRRSWPLVCLVCLGCHSLAEVTQDPKADQKPNPAVQAKELWEKGQEAMKQEQPKQAIAFYEQRLAVDPSMSCNHLSVGAAYVESGNEAAAADHLAKYLESNPEHLSVRVLFAEL